MLIERSLKKQVESLLFKGKIIILYGARQVGKTTLVKEILKKHSGKYVNCELLANKQALETTDEKILKAFIGDVKFLVLDEAQGVVNIGLVLKIIHDTFPDIQIIATGSSSFELANKIGEPLTGRTYTFVLYPLSLRELSVHYSRIELDLFIPTILRFGLYPSTWNKSDSLRIREINDIASKYLYRDILEYENIKKSNVLVVLLQALALQAGNEVSIHELSRLVKLNVHTIDKYLDLLEKCFIIYRLRSFSRNQRNELAKSQKIFFYDLGIRNSVIQNFNNMEIRAEVGALWENFCIIERLKNNQANELWVNQFFWRNYNKQEIDLVEEHGGKIYGYEFKWGKIDKYSAPKQFIETYKAEVKAINRENYHSFLLT